MPNEVLWAWDRAEDLRFLAPRGDAIGVAYLDTNVTLNGAQISVRRRRAALELAPETPRLPVVHVEAHTPALDDAQRDALVDAVVGVAARARQSRVQLDFEALPSQRAFYRGVVASLRARLGPSVSLSITALTSWCAGDRWLEDLPVDEIVPMFYGLGSDAKLLHDELARGVDLAPECRHAFGLMTDEAAVTTPAPRRLYLFSRSPWRPTGLDAEERALAAAGWRS